VEGRDSFFPFFFPSARAFFPLFSPDSFFLRFSFSIRQEIKGTLLPFAAGGEGHFSSPLTVETCPFLSSGMCFLKGFLSLVQPLLSSRKERALSLPSSFLAGRNPYQLSFSSAEENGFLPFLPPPFLRKKRRVKESTPLFRKTRAPRPLPLFRGGRRWKCSPSPSSFLSRISKGGSFFLFPLPLFLSIGRELQLSLFADGMMRNSLSPLLLPRWGEKCSSSLS